MAILKLSGARFGDDRSLDCNASGLVGPAGWRPKYLMRPSSNFYEAHCTQLKIIRRVNSSERSQRLLDPVLFTPFQKAIHQVSPFLLSLSPIQPSFHLVLTPTLNLLPNRS